MVRADRPASRPRSRGSPDRRTPLGSGHSADPELLYISRDVISECAGFPLGAVVLLLAAIGVSIYATQQRKTASAAKQEAQTSQIAADVAARSAKEQEQLARQNAERANENARQSELHAAEARDNAAKAESQQRLTEQQTGIAEARLLAVEANLARAQRPELLSRSVLLGIEAIRKFPSAETDQALRQGLDLLPRRIGVFKHDDDVIAVAFSRDGKRLATTGRIRAIQMWDAGSREVVGSQVKYSEATARSMPLR